MLSRETKVEPKTGKTPEPSPEHRTGEGARLENGRPLDGAVRGRMERAFGRNFGAVRLHTGTTADHLNQSYSARAFTSGTDIAFAAGEYRPETIAGDALLAHELAHVVQQTSGSHGAARSITVVLDPSGRSGLYGSTEPSMWRLVPTTPIAADLVCPVETR